MTRNTLPGLTSPVDGRIPLESMNPTCQQGTVQAGGRSVMVWGMCSSAHRNPRWTYCRNYFWPTRPLGKCCKIPRVVFRRKINFAYHIEQTRKKAIAVHAMLKKLISRRSKLAIRHKVLLYKSIIRPVMCYGSQILGVI
ncbi:hypothetical protein TNCV_2781061 [Trichonephila clavipes]|nr:hypothetical protein TNCV_2781061 [Trichonephila clavipes]